MQSSVFNLPFQIVICHPILSTNCNNIFLPVLSSCIVILLELFSQRSNHNLHCLHKASKTKNINRTVKLRYISASRSQSQKEYKCFDFLAYSMFTLDGFRGSLGTSIFGRSVSAAKNTRSRLPLDYLSVSYDYVLIRILRCSILPTAVTIQI